MALRALKTHLEQQSCYSLSEIQAESSMTRNDYKFLLPVSNLALFVSQLSGHYDVLNINGNRLFEYRNAYFDDDAFQYYYDQFRGKPRRMKVRLRDYVDSNLRFLEVKKKIKRGKTAKYRVETTASLNDVLQFHGQFLKQEAVNVDTLKHVLNVEYIRICFANRHRSERVSVDINLRFSKPGESVISLDQFIVVEIKQNASRSDSFAFRLLKNRGIREQSFSKYCIGMASCYGKEVKINTFLPMLKALRNNRLKGGLWT